MDPLLPHLLTDLGLSTEEAAVYNALLEFGQSVVTPVANLAKVNRTTCYNILESLVQKKLASKANYRGKISYSPEDPSQLVNNLEEKKQVLDIALEKARALTPELVKRYAQHHAKPIIKYVEGVGGIKELYDDSLRCQNKQEGIRAYSSLRDVTLELGDYANHYYAERARRGIPIMGMVPDTEYGKDVKRKAKEFLRNIRLIPHHRFDFSPEIYLYDNKLAVFSFKERFGFLLESKEIVEALKVAWQLAWERAEEYDKGITI